MLSHQTLERKLFADFGKVEQRVQDKVQDAPDADQLQGQTKGDIVAKEIGEDATGYRRIKLIE
jgi:hypothetical protein